MEPQSLREGTAREELARVAGGCVAVRAPGSPESPGVPNQSILLLFFILLSFLFCHRLTIYME